MHYKDGTPAKVGDYVKGPGYGAKAIVGQVQSVTPGSASCNASVAHTVMQPVVNFAAVTLGDFELVHRDTPPEGDKA